MPKNPFSSYKENNYCTLLCHVTELQVVQSKPQMSKSSKSQRSTLFPL